MMPNEHKDAFLYSLLNICTILGVSLILILILFPSASLSSSAAMASILLYVEILIPDPENRLP